MQTLILNSTLKTIKAKLSGAPTTTNPTFVSSYADSGATFTEGSSDGVLNGTTPVTIVSAPGADLNRVIKSLGIYNGDTASSTVTILYDNNGTQREIAVVTLAAGDTWTNDGTFDNTGALKSTGSGGGGSSVYVNGILVGNPNFIDTAEIGLTKTGSDITLDLKTGSIDETKLDTSVNASLDLADTAVQPAALSVYELLSNKSDSYTVSSSTTYSSTKALVDGLATKQGTIGYTPEDVANKSDSYTASSSTTYSSTKALVDGLGTKQNTITTGTTSEYFRGDLSLATFPSFSAKTYDAVVATSGGDYTLPSLAIAAGCNSIFVREGTYTESAITSSADDFTIVGENNGAIINMGANDMTFTGARVRIGGVKIQFTTGKMSFSGYYCLVNSCWLTKSGAGKLVDVTITGRYMTIQNCVIDDTSTDTTVARILFGATYSRFLANTVTWADSGTLITRGWLTTTQSFCNIANNFFKRSGSSTGILIAIGTADNVIHSNVIEGAGANGTAISLGDYLVVIEANYIFSFGVGINLGSARERCSVIGNMVVNCATNALTMSAGFNNMIMGNTFSGNNNQVGLTGACYGNMFTNNRIRTGNMTISSTSYDNILTANVFDDSAKLVDSGIRTIAQFNLPMSVNNEKRFVTMKNTSGATMNDGNVVVFKSVAAGDEVTTTTTAGDATVFGIAGGTGSATTIANNAYGQIQIAGKNVKCTVDGTTDIAIGDFLTTFTTAGIAKKGAAGDVVFARALEAYTNNDSLGVIDVSLLPAPFKL